MNTTELERWITRLTDALSEQSAKAHFLRRYATKRPPMPKMGPNLEREWQQFQYKSVTNTGGLIVDALAERIIPTGITIDGETSTDLDRIWRDNRLNVTFADTIRDALTVGVGYLSVGIGEDGQATIIRERPEQVVTIPDPVSPWKSLAAMKVWRDSVAEQDHAVIWASGMRWHLTRKSTKGTTPIYGFEEGWKIAGPARPTPAARIPVVRLDNIEGVGEFENHTDLIDRINWGILQRLVMTAMQSFRQRALNVDKDADGLEHTDEDGNEIDYRKIFRPGPGNLWELPPGVSLWESTPIDIRPILDASKDDFRQLASVTRTPVTMLLPDSVNQSAAGAEATREGLTFKARDRIERFKPALAVAFVYALEAEGIPVAGTLKMIFEPPAMVMMSERYDAAIKAKSAGESLESIQRNILGYSPEQIQADRLMRAREQFALAFAERTQLPPVPAASEE